jgi:hypothetical protein
VAILNKNQKTRLFKEIFERIGLEKKLEIVRKNIVSSSIIAVVIVGFFGFAFITMGREIAKSDFWHFFQLIFSDPRIVILYGKDFAASILESIPVFSIVIILVSLSLALLALRMFFSFIDNRVFLSHSVKKLHHGVK